MKTRAVFAYAILSAALATAAPTASAVTLPTFKAFTPCSFGAMSGGGGCGSLSSKRIFKSARPKMSATRGSSSIARAAAPSTVLVTQQVSSNPVALSAVPLPLSGAMLAIAVIGAGGLLRRRASSKTT